MALQRARHPFSKEDVEVGAIGVLSVPTGAIVACDPLVSLRRAQPFTRTVPPGNYRVELAIRDGDVLLATLVISEAPIARWVPALCAGEAESDDLERVPGYPVDAGTGCFVDAATAAARVRVLEAWGESTADRIVASGVDPADPAAWHAAHRMYESERPDLLEQLEAAGYHAGREGVVVPIEDGNIAAFRSGAGDGIYPSYWALDAADAPVALVTDFGLLRTDDVGDEGIDEPDHEEEPTTPSLAQRANKIVEQMLAEQLLVLNRFTNRARFCDALADALGTFLDDNRDVPAALAEWFEEHASVDEVYATDDDLARILE